MAHHILHLMCMLGVGFGHSLIPFEPEQDPMIDLLIATESNSNSIYRKPMKHHYSGDKTANPMSSADIWSDATPAAIQTTQHAIGVKEVDIDSTPLSPQTVIVDATVMPLTIYFRSTSSMIKVIQEHLEAKQNDVQHSQSEDAPHRLYHEVHKPIYQEVHEVIKPYRRIMQEIHPVYEDVKTIISRATDEPRPSKSELYQENTKNSESNRFNYENFDNAYSHEDLHRITPTGRQSDMFVKERVNLTSTPTSQIIDYDNGINNVLSDDLFGYDKVDNRNERKAANKEMADPLNNTTPAATSTTTTMPPPATKVESNHSKHKRHQTASKQHMTFKRTKLDPKVIRNFNQTRRLAIKRLVDKIDRQKRKIRLGFFSLYGINVIPYIYDQFRFDVKIRVPARSSLMDQSSGSSKQ